MTGQTFGRLTVLGEAPTRITPAGHRVKRWRCQCSCGSPERIVQHSHLRSGATQSCGCLRNERVVKACRSHGDKPKNAAPAAEYQAWRGMIARCHNEQNPSFPDYGGRGISVCREWRESYEAFLAAMGRKPSRSHSLDRIDPNGDYEPKNTRWATPQQQAGNRRNVINIELEGQQVCLKEACRQLGLPYTTVTQRIKRGWDRSRWLEPV